MDIVLSHFKYIGDEPDKKDEEYDQRNNRPDLYIMNLFEVIFKHGYLLFAVDSALISVPKRCK